MNKIIISIIIIFLVLIGIFILDKYKKATVTSTGLISQTIVSPLFTDSNSTNLNKNMKEENSNYPLAMELIPGGEFINSEPFKIQDIVGKKVILVDFWTYTCSNCKATTPYLKDWYAKYRDQGFEIIGVQTPEFEFEKDVEKVRAAVKEAGIEYPVMQDNNYDTWNAYNNHYWPHMFLIDKKGRIVYDKIGEGEYDKMDKMIQKYLNE